MSKAAICLSAVLLSVALLAADNKPTPGSTGVVLRKVFMNQVGPIPPTTLLVPGADGIFRVSCYLEASTDPADGNDSVVVTWSDAFNSQLQGFPELSSGTGVGFSQGSVVIHAKGGTPIAVNGLGTTATNTYNVYLAVERL
jgi:hypothetical protein